MKIKQKIICYISFILLIFGFLLAIYIRSSVSQLGKELIIKKSIVLSENIETKVKFFFIAKNMDSMQLSLIEAKKANNDIQSILVIDNDNTVIASSEPERRNTKNQDNQTQNIQKLNEPKIFYLNNSLFEIGLPLMVKVSEYLPEERKGIIRITFSFQQMYSQIGRIQFVFFIFIAVCIGSLIFIISLIITRFVKKPIHRFISSFKKGMEGDLTIKIESTSDDEIGILSHYFNDFIEKIIAIMNSLKTAANDVTSGYISLLNSINKSKDLIHQMGIQAGDISSNIDLQSSSVNQTSSTINQMIGSIVSISQNINTQAAAISQSSASIEQMNASMNIIAATASKAGEVSKKLSVVAEDGGNSIINTIDAIKSIEESSKKISAIVSIISNISEQTNLLAMNAAIEAAHAGEYGKGFAVVADEIRKLSESSSASAKEITTLIKEITGKIKRTVDLTEKASNGLNSILNDVQETNIINSEISNAIREQTHGAHEIMKSILELVSITEAIKYSIDEQKNGNQEINTVITNLEKITSKISHSVKKNNDNSLEIIQAMNHIEKVCDDNKNIAFHLESIINEFKTVDSKEKIGVSERKG